jgi:hypothetical protein
LAYIQKSNISTSQTPLVVPSQVPLSDHGSRASRSNCAKGANPVRSISC